MSCILYCTTYSIVYWDHITLHYNVQCAVHYTLHYILHRLASIGLSWPKNRETLSFKPYCTLYWTPTYIEVFKVYQEVSLMYQEHNPTVHCIKHNNVQCTVHYTVSVLGRDKGYTVKYSPPPEGVPEGKARGNSRMWMSLFDLISRVVF